MSEYRPLADILRPETLDDVVGQEHILGPDGMLRRIVESGEVPNMIFYGPSGTGKTTVASIIAKRTNRSLRRLNATTAGIADIRAIIDELDTFMTPGGVLLYLDEIQYFNKKQQQSLLQYIENGDITLIASTTENPYFYIYPAVLSRSTVFEFKSITPADAIPGIQRALRFLEAENGVTYAPEDGLLPFIAEASGGDMRKALGICELTVLSAGMAETGKTVPLTLARAEEVCKRTGAHYDRGGDAYYDLLSAFQKSMRGSDPDAAVHYLARILEAGDLPSACRRLMVCACEDVGLAYPMIIPIVKAAVDIAFQVGLPEARIPLADAVILVATSPKSNAAYNAINAAMADVEKGRGGPVPRQLQNKHFDGADAAVRGQHYLYPHDFPNHWTRQQYLPDNLKNTVYYTFGDSKTEQSAKAYWDAIKK